MSKIVKCRNFTAPKFCIFPVALSYQSNGTIALVQFPSPSLGFTQPFHPIYDLSLGTEFLDSLDEIGCLDVA